MSAACLGCGRGQKRGSLSSSPPRPVRRPHPSAVTAHQQQKTNTTTRRSCVVENNTAVKIKKTGGSTKFKVRCSRYLYTLVVADHDKADKLKQSLPPGANCLFAEALDRFFATERLRCIGGGEGEMFERDAESQAQCLASPFGEERGLLPRGQGNTALE